MKKIKLGRPKLRSYKALRAQAWDVFSLYIRTRDKFICFTCGKQLDKASSQAGHFIHRNCLDFDERAINTQCVKCNNYLSGNLVVYTVKMFEKYGKETIEELQLLSNQVRKFRRDELEDMIADYKAKLVSIGGE